MATRRRIDAATWRRVALCVIGGLLGALLLALHAHRYLAYVSDDAYISLRYAARWAHGAGLTWNDGERVEGFSNPLWTMTLGVLLKLHVAPRAALRLLGGTSAFVAIAGSMVLAARSIQGWPLLIVPLGVSASGAVAVWIDGGLESVSVLALFVVAAGVLPAPLGARTRIARMLAVLAFLLLPQARLDAGLLAVGLLLGRAFLVRRIERRQLVLFVAMLLGVALASVLRWRYYGDWLPNTAHVKLARPDVRQGVAYVMHFALSHAPLLPLVIYALVAGGPLVPALVPTLVLELVYVVSLSGDFMPGYRFLVPVVGILVLLAAAGAAALRDALGRRAPYAIICATLLLATFALAQSIDPYIVEAESQTWAHDGLVVGRVLANGFAPARPLLAVDAAGAMPFSSQLPALDLLGLTDRHIAHAPHRQGSITGHTVGDGNYAWDREPDLLVFNGPHGGVPRFPSGEELVAHTGFTARYQPLHIVMPVDTLAWIRVDRALQDAQHVTLHAYLALDAPPLHPDARGRLVADTPTLTFDLRRLRGTWKIDGQACSIVAGPRVELTMGSELSLTRCGETSAN